MAAARRSSSSTIDVSDQARVFVNRARASARVRPWAGVVGEVLEERLAHH